jgi:hypothetical protein
MRPQRGRGFPAQLGSWDNAAPHPPRVFKKQNSTHAHAQPMALNRPMGGGEGHVETQPGRAPCGSIRTTVLHAGGGAGLQASGYMQEAPPRHRHRQVTTSTGRRATRPHLLPADITNLVPQQPLTHTTTHTTSTTTSSRRQLARHAAPAPHL